VGPAEVEIGRVPWRDVPLPQNYPQSANERESLLDQRPVTGAPGTTTLREQLRSTGQVGAASMTADQVREVNALNAVEVELIDEAIGRVLASIDRKGWGDDVDVIFTSDHGELQGDFGLLFKGPYHVDGLMRLPLIWRPARSSEPAPSVVHAPVSSSRSRRRSSTIAGEPAPTWVEGAAYRSTTMTAKRRSFEATFTVMGSSIFGVDVHVRTVVTRRLPLQPSTNPVRSRRQ